MNTKTRVSRLQTHIALAILSLLLCTSAHAQEVIEWRSLGLGQALRALMNSDAECPFSKVNTRVAPSTVWALDRPFAASDFETTVNAKAFVPSEELRKAVSAKEADFKASYGVVVTSGEVVLAEVGPCTTAQATALRVGHFAFLTIDIQFAHARLASYLRNTFRPDALPPDQLLLVVESLKQSLPDSVFIQMRLVSDLGETLQGWDAIGRPLAMCNLGQFSACSDAIQAFSHTLRTGTGIADLLARLKRRTLLIPDASVLGAFVEATPASVALRLKSTDTDLQLKALLAKLNQSVSPSHAAEFEKIQADAGALAERLKTSPGLAGQERDLEQKATAIMQAALDLTSREGSFRACEILERDHWALLERILAPLPLSNCDLAAKASANLESWRLETSDDLNKMAWPLLLSRKMVEVSDAMVGRRETPLFLLDLPFLEEVKVTEPPTEFLYEILERSGVRIVKE